MPPPTEIRLPWGGMVDITEEGIEGMDQTLFIGDTSTIPSFDNSNKGEIGAYIDDVMRFLYACMAHHIYYGQHGRYLLKFTAADLPRRPPPNARTDVVWFRDSHRFSVYPSDINLRRRYIESLFIALMSTIHNPFPSNIAVCADDGWFARCYLLPATAIATSSRANALTSSCANTHLARVASISTPGDSASNPVVID
ncbi:hypothetical protein BT63DRAFT_436706 [Microthyrium microscopicum]|uniref:Uncharacterized protein n=1 Tax=Microthyrium microscopicum TaxID=703497 RepID=A0A6A6UN26_9PEZI|nr:hypothetical protein BT63DRAFT_436706 [Microthyrium microscopicum]